MGNIGLIVFNLILFAMLVLAWQLWRQAVPKRRKVKAVEVADWPAGPEADAVGMQAQAGAMSAGPASSMPAAADVTPQLVGAGVAGSSAVDTSVPSVPSFAAPPAPTPPAAADSIDASAFAAPAPASSPEPISAGATVGAIDDAELAALLQTAPPTSVAPVPSVSPQAPSFAAPVTAPVAPVHPPSSPSALFSSPAPVSSLAPPAAVAASNGPSTAVADDISRQVGALLAAPSPAAQPQSSLAAPPAQTTSVGGTDRLRLDITGRPVDDVMRSLATRLGDMGYSAQSGPSGETVFQRGTTESIRIAVSAQEAASTDADGRPLPARADVEVVGGQLQETTEAVLFELLDHGFQLRWAVAGELVLSSFDGALARVNVNPTTSS